MVSNVEKLEDSTTSAMESPKLENPSSSMPDVEVTLSTDVLESGRVESVVNEFPSHEERRLEPEDLRFTRSRTMPVSKVTMNDIDKAQLIQKSKSHHEEEEETNEKDIPIDKLLKMHDTMAESTLKAVEDPAKKKGFSFKKTLSMLSRSSKGADNKDRQSDAIVEEKKEDIDPVATECLRPEILPSNHEVEVKSDSKNSSVVETDRGTGKEIAVDSELKSELNVENGLTDATAMAATSEGSSPKSVSSKGKFNNKSQVNVSDEALKETNQNVKADAEAITNVKSDVSEKSNKTTSSDKSVKSSRSVKSNKSTTSNRSARSNKSGKSTGNKSILHPTGAKGNKSVGFDEHKVRSAVSFDVNSFKAKDLAEDAKNQDDQSNETTLEDNVIHENTVVADQSAIKVVGDNSSLISTSVDQSKNDQAVETLEQNVVSNEGEKVIKDEISVTSSENAPSSFKDQSCNDTETKEKKVSEKELGPIEVKKSFSFKRAFSLQRSPSSASKTSSNSKSSGSSNKQGTVIEQKEELPPIPLTNSSKRSEVSALSVTAVNVVPLKKSPSLLNTLPLKKQSSGLSVSSKKSVTSNKSASSRKSSSSKTSKVLEVSTSKAEPEPELDTSPRFGRAYDIFAASVEKAERDNALSLDNAVNESEKKQIDESMEPVSGAEDLKTVDGDTSTQISKPDDLATTTATEATVQVASADKSIDYYAEEKKEDPSDYTKPAKVDWKAAAKEVSVKYDSLMANLKGDLSKDKKNRLLRDSKTNKPIELESKPQENFKGETTKAVDGGENTTRDMKQTSATTTTVTTDPWKMLCFCW